MKEQLLEALKYFDENDELILLRKEDLERNISQTTEMYKNTIKTQWEQIKELINRIDKAISFLKNIGYDEEMGRIWNDMSDDDLNLLKESKEVLINHINMQHSATTLTTAFGIKTDTLEEEHKAKTLELLICLLEERKQYKEDMIQKQIEKETLERNKKELMNIFGNL